MINCVGFHDILILWDILSNAQGFLQQLAWWLKSASGFNGYAKAPLMQAIDRLESTVAGPPELHSARQNSLDSTVFEFSGVF